MSSDSNVGSAPYNIEVVNTYPQPVDCTVYIQSATGQPAPTPMLSMQPNTIQSPGSGDTLFAQISYPPPSGGTPQTISIPYGAPIDLGRTLNVMWNTSPSTQVIVIVETEIGK